MSATELPIAAAPVATISRERYAELAARVRRLSWLSLAWMTVEGAVALAAGIAASSIALVGFGLDSVPTSPPHCSSACSATRSSAHGGSTPASGC